MEYLTRGSVFLACLAPFAYLVLVLGSGGGGPDPAELIMHITGQWSARCLLLSLLVSPLRTWIAWSVVLKLRRMLGLFAFFYATVHLTSFAHFYAGWTFPILLEELLERPYITFGFGAWLLMLPLALTSTRSMQRRLRRNWQRLHRAVYPTAVFVCIHIIWQVRSDVGEALLYLALFSGLLLWRYLRVKRRA